MSAVRMVAYGVLELKSPSAEAKPWLRDFTDAEREQDAAARFEFDQLLKLVKDELKRYGLLLERDVVSRGTQWRTSTGTFNLYGQRQGPKNFQTRPHLVKGSFKECCVCAAEVLDVLDAAQVPDAQTSIPE